MYLASDGGKRYVVDYRPARQVAGRQWRFAGNRRAKHPLESEGREFLTLRQRIGHVQRPRVDQLLARILFSSLSTHSGSLSAANSVPSSASDPSSRIKSHLPGWRSLSCSNVPCIVPCFPGAARYTRPISFAAGSHPPRTPPFVHLQSNTLCLHEYCEKVANKMGKIS